MPKSVVVTIDDDHQASINEVVEQLRAAGMHVDQIHHAVDVVTGEVSDAQRPIISQLPAVGSVEDQTIFQVPPPESEIQ